MSSDASSSAQPASDVQRIEATRASLRNLRSRLATIDRVRVALSAVDAGDALLVRAPRRATCLR
jgi:hypothetical protein